MYIYWILDDTGTFSVFWTVESLTIWWESGHVEINNRLEMELKKSSKLPYRDGYQGNAISIEFNNTQLSPSLGGVFFWFIKP